MIVGNGLASQLNRRIRIERPVGDDGFEGAGSGQWVTVAQVAAQVTDALPSRGERLAGGINVASRPARVRIRSRPDITPDMRFALLRRKNGAWLVDRVMQIIAGPARVETLDAIEFMVEDYSSSGNAA